MTLDTRTITVSDASRAVWVIGIRYVWTSQKYLNAVQRLERELGCSCINGLYLDELEPGRGRMDMEIFPECGIMCYLMDTM